MVTCGIAGSFGLPQWFFLVYLFPNCTIPTIKISFIIYLCLTFAKVVQTESSGLQNKKRESVSCRGVWLAGEQLYNAGENSHFSGHARQPLAIDAQTRLTTIGRVRV